MTKRYKLYIIARELFQAMLVTYMILIVVETLRSGYVSNFFNLNYLLIGVLITGIIMVITDSKGFAYRLRFKK